MACLVLLLAIVWYLFFSNLWFHHMPAKQRVLDALPQPEPKPETKPEPDEPAPEPEPEEQKPEEPEPAPEPEPVNGPEATVFIPPQPEPEAQTAAPENAKADPEPQGWAAAPESAERPAQKPTRRRICPQDGGGEGRGEGRKLQQAAQEKQAHRARKLEEDAARQQKKLEELRAEAAGKNPPPPKSGWTGKTASSNFNKKVPCAQAHRNLFYCHSLYTGPTVSHSLLNSMPSTTASTRQPSQMAFAPSGPTASALMAAPTRKARITP